MQGNGESGKAGSVMALGTEQSAPSRFSGGVSEASGTGGGREGAEKEANTVECRSSAGEVDAEGLEQHYAGDECFPGDDGSEEEDGEEQGEEAAVEALFGQVLNLQEQLQERDMENARLKQQLQDQKNLMQQVGYRE